MDRRVQKTRQLILDSFNCLLEEKHFDKITVNEIIEKANIGRSTFYSHFETKDDVLKAVCINLFEHVFSDALYTENNHGLKLENIISKQIISHILYHLALNRKNIVGIITYDNGVIFLDFFKQYLTKFFALKNNLDSKQKDIPNDLLISHVLSSFINIVQWWVKNNLKQSPDEISKYFYQMIENLIN